MTTLPRSTSGDTRPRRLRRGAVSVEFALVVPILFMVLFGIIEFARLNMLRNSIENAAYEGARRGIVPGATADDVRADALKLLNEVSVTDGQVSVSPPTIDATTTQLTVTVNVPLSGAAWLFYFAQKSNVMSRSATLNRESM